MTDIGHVGEEASAEDAEIDRLVLKGLAAPLSAAEAERLESLTLTSPERAARAERLVETWLLAGVLGEERVARGRPPAPPHRRWFVAGGLGAGAAVAASAALWLGRGASPVIYQAPDTGPLRATLADGSRVVLSRGGRMEARLDGRRRDVRLISGEAFYAVAKDASRPFRVDVADHRLTVLGTRFNVDPDAEGLRVSLLEGSLRVEQIGQPKLDAIVLKPGEEYRAGREPRVAAADVEASAAWTDGRLVFDDAALTQVAADLGRQTGQTLAFAEPGLAAMRFSGVLRLDSPQDWQAALEAVLPVRLSRTAGGYRVARR
jgi:transmembrane sensor